MNEELKLRAEHQTHFYQTNRRPKVPVWTAHYFLFRTPGWIAWVGTVVVVENVVSSLVHSHLFDFFHGWLYVLGVGVAGGMMLRANPH